MFEFLLALFTAGTVAVLLVPLMRRSVSATGRRESELALYRDQLAELERERVSGGLAAAEADAARTEIERRLLAAAETEAPSPRPAADTLHKFLTPALCLAIPALALGLYLDLGTPGLPSAPFYPRVTQPGDTTPAAPDLARELAAVRQRLAAAPDDPEALSSLGELLTMEAQGIVTPPAVEAFDKALSKQKDDPRALFYLGLHESQAGDSKAALTRWLDLEARSPEGAPWLPSLRAEIARLARDAKLDPQQIRPDRKPPVAPGGAASAPGTTAGNATGTVPGMPQPSQEQMQAMAKMSPEERQQAIRGMVDGLEAKMADTPADRDGWLRLANARRVLGDAAKASAAYAKADALQPLDSRLLADWAETEVRQIQPGAPPSAEAVGVLERLEKADPGNALALFYLGAADFARGSKVKAVRRWKVLLGKLPSDAPIRQMLEAKIKEAE